MKKPLPALIVLIVLGVLISPLYTPVYPVFAQDNTTPVQKLQRPSGPTNLVQAKRANQASVSATAKPVVVKRIEKVASKSGIAKDKIQKFRDKKRAETAQRVNTKLPEINKTRTDNMSANLVKMTEILAKLETRVAEASNNGKDITEAQNAITQAKADISAAQTAVTEQSQKDYGITVTTESKIAADAKTARDALFNDLKTTHDLVVTARQSLAEAISTASSTLGGQK